MKLLFLDAYYYPEIIAFSHIEDDLTEGLMSAGHDITVVCPTPCRGISDAAVREYRHKLIEDRCGIHIHRYPTPRERKNPVRRAFRYFWCNIRGNRVAKKYRGADLIFAVSTPPTQGYFAGKLAKKLRVPLVYSLQDIFPDSLVSTGLTKRGSLLYRIGARIERRTYERCERIIVLSHTAERNLLDKGVPPERLLTVSNWIDTDKVRPIPREENRLFDEYDVDRDAFTVVYAGNFGASQGADVILKAARLLADHTDIRFVLFGAGSMFEDARRQAESLLNVIISPLLPAERVAEVYSMGDIALITCKKGVGKTALPSKLWSIMACGTPVIAAFDADSELADIIREADAGVCAEPEDPQALADAVLDAYRKRGSVQRPLASAREYVLRHASRETGVESYVRCIEEAARRTN